MAGPPVRVLRGNPSDAEVAALVAVVLGLTARRPAPSVPPRRAWSDPDRWSRGSTRARPDAWRLAALPR